MNTELTKLFSVNFEIIVETSSQGHILHAYSGQGAILCFCFIRQYIIKIHPIVNLLLLTSADSNHAAYLCLFLSLKNALRL